jgi:hypothetical protein
LFRIAAATLILLAIKPEVVLTPLVAVGAGLARHLPSPPSAAGAEALAAAAGRCLNAADPALCMALEKARRGLAPAPPPP